MLALSKVVILALERHRSSKDLRQVLKLHDFMCKNVWWNSLFPVRFNNIFVGGTA